MRRRGNHARAALGLLHHLGRDGRQRVASSLALPSRLGWEPGILNGNGLKPKGMHWRTFERLQGQHDAHVNAALAGELARLRRMVGKG